MLSSSKSPAGTPVLLSQCAKQSFIFDMTEIETRRRGVTLRGSLGSGGRCRDFSAV